ncbi:hypothetical protein SELMODRAFT_411414 [Selaginella moellendorffii]|uniref:Uncharacterized protein n=1 Tax=Selaginella moellendorffii TaxID=88036 RepID=D8RHU7_SELML|nr:hypothetical protein SELMODRAFT_411414 [Selaginella moellendorffii]
MIDLADKCIQLGLQYPDSIEWHNWIPGREYHKILYVRNKIYKTQVIQWCAPPSSQFWTTYNEPVRLNGLVTVAIGVVFRPSKLQWYESVIEFSSTKGDFSVTLRGIPPLVCLSFQKALWLGYCPVNDFTERKFIMRNLGDTILTASWKVHLPFTIAPEKVTINPGDALLATGRFAPRKAGPYEAVALCWIGGMSVKLQLHGVGKHSFLTLSQTMINFGSLFLGTVRVIYLKVTNNSAVPSFYQLKRLNTDSDFTVEPAEGTIPEGSTHYLKLTYRPTVAGSCPVEHFDLVVPQTSPVSFTCVGGVLRPTVRISSFTVSFGTVESGGHSSRSITLKNQTDLPVLFQFMPGDMGVFQFHESNGCIAPRSTVILTVKFKPIEPANYYVRVMCIIKDQYPLYCDLVGTCFRDIVRASTLMSYHIDRHRQSLIDRKGKKPEPMTTNFWSSDRTQVAEGDESEVEDFDQWNMSTVSEHGTTTVPDMLKGLLVPQENRKSMLGDFFVDSIPVFSKAVMKANEVWDEYFNGSMDGWDPVTLDVTQVDFGMCECNGSSHTKNITVKNNSRDGHVNIIWVIREPHLEMIKPTGAYVDSDFSEMMYYKNFDPLPNFYYFKHMACFVYDISSSKGTSNVLPPWTIIGSCFGHTFHSHSWEVRPEAFFDPGRVVFQPALQGSCVYQTVALRNLKHTALRFFFPREFLWPEFSLTPMEGVIPGANEIYLCPNNPDRLLLQMEVSNGTSICFKPTNIGTREHLPITLTNTSDIALQYDCLVPMEYGDIISLSPASGVLRGKEKQEVICTFSPLDEKYYSFQISCSYSGCIETAYYQEHKVLTRNCPTPKTDYFTLDIDGEGLVGVITVEPGRADFGMLVVNNQYEHKLSLYNSTKGLLEYALSCHSLSITSDKYSITFDTPTDSIAPKSYKDVMVLFTLKYNIHYKMDIQCKTLAPTTDECLAKHKPVGAYTTCAFSAVAAYPAVVISGVRSERLSAAQLWSRLRIDDLNHALSEPPRPALTNSVYKYLFGLGKPLDDFKPFMLRFMAQNVGRKPSVVHIVFTCRVPLTVSWKIRLWNDTEVDMESWVEDGEPSEEEKRLVQVWKMKLFEVEPRRGVIQPGEEVHVRFTYYHKIEGFHSFPAIFEIEGGCVVQLMLSGKTLPFSQKILGLQSPAYTLVPIVIGDINPPVQTYELRNDGYMELVYELDTSPLRQMQDENHGFPVLQCFNPKGWIAPSESILLKWLFQPLEPKLYSVRLTFYVEGGKQNNLDIQGMGFSSTERASLRYTQLRPPFGKAYVWSGLPAKLSTEFLDFGHVKELTLTQKLVSIQNVSDEYEVSYNWRNSMAADFMIYGDFDVFPRSGVIQPQEEILCKVRFRAGIQPQYFMTTLYCDIAVVNLEPPPRQVLIQPSTPEEVIDRDGYRLGTGVYNKMFRHIPVINQCPEGMRGRLPHFTPRPLSALPTPPKIAVPPDQVLFLTVNTEVHTAEKFHSTSERVMKEFISFRDGQDEKRLNESSREVQSEMAGLMLMEMLQELLFEEAKDSDQSSFRAFDDKRVVYFEEIKGLSSQGADCTKAKIKLDKLAWEDAFKVTQKNMVELVLDSLLFGIVKDMCENSFTSCTRSSRQCQ